MAITLGSLRKELSGNGVATGDVELLLSNVTGRNTAWLRANEDADIGDAMAATARDFVKRRATGEPVPYIVGSVGFHGHVLLVDAHVLVPRPETEHLIDTALEHLRRHGYQRPRILDVGTGSGAIACTLATEFPHSFVHGTDISPEALLVALANAHRYGVDERISFYFGDLVAPLRGKTYDVVIANLPYVPTADIAKAPDPVSFEPRLALDGGGDGLEVYRRLLPELHGLFYSGGLLLLEAAPPNIRELASLAAEAFPYSTVQIGKDYAGLERYVKVTDPA